MHQNNPPLVLPCMNDFERYLPYFEALEPPQGVFARVMLKIHTARLRRLWLGLAFVATAFMTSCVAAFLSWQAIVAEVGASPLVGYLKLLVSDPDIVLGNMQDFAYGVFDSLPLQSILVVLLLSVIVVGGIALMQSLQRERRHFLLHI